MGRALIGGAGGCGSLAMLAAMRRASSRVRLIARQAVRRSDMSGIGGKAEVRDLRLKRR